MGWFLEIGNNGPHIVMVFNLKLSEVVDNETHITWPDKHIITCNHIVNKKVNFVFVEHYTCWSAISCAMFTVTHKTNVGATNVT